jgi:pimeloyl-ACP methyl ester carboxylesterase
MTPEPIEFTVEHDTFLRGQYWAGDALTTLLVHEPGDEFDLDRWQPLIPYLLGAGATVVTIDLRGHGASDGDWDAAQDHTDLATVAGELTRRWAAKLVIIAAGESAIAAIRAAEAAKIDGVIALSPSNVPGEPPRGAGESKLLIRAGGDDRKGDLDRIRPALIGPSVFLTVPGAETGTALLSGESALTCREHILSFLREIRAESPAKSAPDRFLEVIGIKKGRTT